MRCAFLPVLAAALFAAMADGAETRWRDQFLLIESAKADARPGLERLGAGFEKEVGAAPDSEVAKFLRAESFEKWKTFEDEHLRFSYPDFPGMKVEVVPRGDTKPIPIYGAPLRTSPRGFTQIYRVAVGEITWAMLFLQKAEQLNRGVCFCGAVVLETLLPHDGSLYAYSLLETGELKSMQALGDGWRVELFEWTHSPLTPALYLALAESVVLKHPSPRTEAEWRDFTLREEERRADVQFGWLRRGMKQEEAVALLGQPTRQSPNELVYERINKELLAKNTIRVPLRDGAFQGFSSECWKYEEIPPDRGTLAWAQKLTEDYRDKPAPKRGKQFIKDAKEGMESFLQKAPTLKDQEWNDWCAVVMKLAEAGVRDTRVIPIITARFLSPEDTMHYAAQILNQYQAPGRQELYLKRLRLTLADAGKFPKNEHRDWPFGDFYDLMSLLGPAKDRGALVREGLTHAHASIRGDSLLFLKWLPKDEARLAAKRGLVDADKRVRYFAAKALAEGLATVNESSVLEARLELESEEDVREQLREALARSRRK